MASQMHILANEFVQVLSNSHLKMRVWERGAGATLACGTGACATVVAAVLEGHAGRHGGVPVGHCVNAVVLHFGVAVGDSIIAV
ncbi:hypothetical protein ACSQ67_001510 [Phaseolus vulgaris]